MDNLPKRKHIRIEDYDYSTPGAYSLRSALQTEKKSFGLTVGAISKQIDKSLWQKSFYDHGIRNQQDYDEIWKYIENNPLKYALTSIIMEKKVSGRDHHEEQKRKSGAIWRPGQHHLGL